MFPADTNSMPEQFVPMEMLSVGEGGGRYYGNGRVDVTFTDGDGTLYFDERKKS